jgi:outer membrane protein OmpA-like peptidoglycan-associated protein
MNPRILRSLLAFAALGTTVAGCAPRVFGDTIAFEIAGSPPPAPRVAAVPSQIVLREMVQFASNSDEILSVSHVVLDEAAAEILGEPRIRRIRIEGHASADGNDTHNFELSGRRAEAVRAYLVEHGVAADVLVAEGFGENRPIADNASPEGRELNRRVELHVIATTDGVAEGAASP